MIIYRFYNNLASSQENEIQSKEMTDSFLSVKLTFIKHLQYFLKEHLQKVFFNE